jgi:N utilization substance protein A
VAAKQEGIDPVGCCVGLRGIRIQNIVNELNGERIDVVAWNADPAVFIASALSPAQVSNVKVVEGIAQVVVPDRQLSLAIGKDGQNARLAAKLTGFRIDIKAASVAAAERAAEEAKVTEAAKEAAPAEKVEKVAKPREKKPVEVPVTAEEPQPVTAELEIEEEEKEAVAAEAVPVKLEEALAPLAEGEQAVEEEETPSEELEEITLAPVPSMVKSQIRFAEDIFEDRMHKSTSKSRKKRKGLRGRAGTDEGLRLRKARTTVSEDTGQEDS